MITAAHCIASLPVYESNNIYNMVNLGNKTVISILTNSNSEFDGTNNYGIVGAKALYAVYPTSFNVNDFKTFIWDIAIIVFKDGTFTDVEPKLTVAGFRPDEGSLVRLVGYGCKTITNRYCNRYGCDEVVECYTDNNGRSISTKRTGTVSVVDNSDGNSYCDPRMLQLNQKKAKDDAHIVQGDGNNSYMVDGNGNYYDVSQGEDVNSAQGDSGSPVLIDSNLNNGTLKFVGITSWGNMKFQDNKETCYTDPLFTDNIRFLKATLQSPINASIPWLE